MSDAEGGSIIGAIPVTIGVMRPEGVATATEMSIPSDISILPRNIKYHNELGVKMIVIV